MERLELALVVPDGLIHLAATVQHWETVIFPLNRLVFTIQHVSAVQF